MIGMILILAGCASGDRFSTPYASGFVADSPIQCVPYARSASQIDIYGNAHTWWTKAEGKYPRGNTPKPGAVLVLKQKGSMTYGHVAVVKNVVNAREIDIAHSNWGSDRQTRSVVYESMRITDVSPANDWSQIRFWNMKESSFGSIYPAYGFIYG